MTTLLKIFGYPHELLHVLALLLIGRRAVKFTSRHVELPDDLSKREYVFVAALPGLVFFVVMAVSIIGLLSAETWKEMIAGLIGVLVGGFGVASAMGDFELIVQRLQARE